MERTVKLGILGCGPRGMQMARIALLLPDCCTLVAMSDPDENAFANASQAFPNIRMFRSSDDLLDSGLVDAVITLDSIEEGNYLWEKVNSAKAIYMCGSNPNYRAKTAFMMKLKDMNLLGQVAYVEAEYVHGTGEKVKKASWRNAYESCRYCTHSLGPVLQLIGEEFTAVSCMSTYDILQNGRAHNAMAALLHTKSNIVMRLLTAFGLPTHGPQHTTRILAEKGNLILHNERAKLWLKDLNDVSSENDFIDIPLTPQGSSRPLSLPILNEDIFAAAHYGHNGSDNIMLRDFADAILNGKPSPLGIREGLAMTLPGIYAAESAREGGALKTIKYPWS